MMIIDHVGFINNIDHVTAARAMATMKPIAASEALQDQVNTDL